MDIPNNLGFAGDDSDIPTFYRLNSEVVEKPSASDDERLEYFADPSPSSPSPPPGIYQGPVSPAHSSSKTDSEGSESWWPVVPNWGGPEEGRDVGVSGHDGLLAFSLCLTGGLSDSELDAQGDVDEGFDEEFEEKDLNESDNNNHHRQQQPSFQMDELDPKELQQLLGMEPDLSGLIDLGVDVLDNDQGHPILSPLSVNSPISHAASPVHVVSLSTSPSPSMDAHVQVMQRNRWNQTGESQGPASVQSCGSGNEVGGDVNEGMMEYNEQLAMLVSACNEVDTNHTSHLMDLSETFALATLPPAASESPSTDLHSMLLFGNGSGQLSLLPPNSTMDAAPTTDTVGHVTSQVTTLVDSSMFPSLELPSLASSSSHIDTDIYSHISLAYRHPAPAASPVSTTSTHITTSPPPSPSPSLEQDDFSSEERKLIDLPWYQFRKLLDDPSIPDRKKEDMKNIRRKGKNKAAAKVCRHKKMHKIKGLEHEIEELKRTKQQMAFRSKSLEREIAQFKRQCHQS